MSVAYSYLFNCKFTTSSQNLTCNCRLYGLAGKSIDDLDKSLDKQNDVPATLVPAGHLVADDFNENRIKEEKYFVNRQDDALTISKFNN